MAEWLMALVLKTSIRKYRKFESCPFRHVFSRKNSPRRANFLATVFKTWVLALVAVLVIIVAVLLGNRLHCKLSCHVNIVAY